MRELILNAEWPAVMTWGCVFFAALYLGFGAVTTALTRWFWPRLGVGTRLDHRPLAAGQLRREWGWSAVSIVLFGVGSVVPWGLLQMGASGLAASPSIGRVAVELVVLLVWNEVHFYATHRGLHGRWLRRFHLAHHRSVVVTPWSTYAFHPVEALLLGPVIVWPMLVHDFAVWSLLAVPVFSIAFNSVGHSNFGLGCNPGARGPRAWWTDAAQRHQLHHACYHGNYGFMWPFMDRWLGTALPPAADEPRRGADDSSPGAHAA